jgi:hypothetical protein
MREYLWLSLMGLTMVAMAQNAEVARPPDFTKLSYDEASIAVDAKVASIVVQHSRKPGPEYFESLDIQLQYGHLKNDNKVLAIYLLGELRPANLASINILIDNIDLKAEKLDRILKFGISIVRWGDYPAKEALIKIAQPSINPVLNHLPIEDNDLRQRLLCEVLRQVEGKAAAQVQIKRKLSEVQENLQSALNEL